MTYIICHALYIFFIILEIILFLYIMSSWIPNAVRFRTLLTALLDPVFGPLRFLLHHSIFYNLSMDLTPMIALILISYLQTLFYGLST